MRRVITCSYASLLVRHRFLTETVLPPLLYERHWRMAVTTNAVGKTKSYADQSHHDATCDWELMAERTLPHVPHR